MWSKLVCLYACLGAALAQSETLEVRIDQGTLRGYRHSQGGVYVFSDVPYATVPKGEDKFKAALPAPVWNETFDAVSRSIICPQLHLNMFNMQEDCLVANIFAPDTDATNLPVYVYVHGGAQIAGFGFMYQFADLVRMEDIVVVTFNYRLGLRGYLCLGTEDVPGNAALKDQVTLLRWVNRNIASFGGNPNDVTIGGCSTGGGSVEFLSVSPMAEGLFNKVIIESGSLFGITATQGDPIANARRIAHYLNFTDTNDLKALEQFYKNASDEILMTANELLEVDTYGNSILVAPCVERVTGAEMFLHDTPWNILRNGNYTRRPLLSGFSEMEGLVRIYGFDAIKDSMNERFSDYIPDDLRFENQSQKEEFAERTKQLYFGSLGVSEATILSYVEYFTDLLFGYPMLRSASLRKASLNDTIYFYEYTFVDEETPFVPHTNIRGANHCYQVNGIADHNMTISTADYKHMALIMRELWLNFIITGNPTPESSTVNVPTWLPMTGYMSPYMSLKAYSTLETTPLLEPRGKFWDDIYETNYKQPVPPSGAALETIPSPTEGPNTPDPNNAVTSTLSFNLLQTIIIINFIL